MVESLAPRKVVVRTCDIGADKTVDYMKLDHEDNPALGYRAIRICSLSASIDVVMSPLKQTKSYLPGFTSL